MAAEECQDITAELAPQSLNNSLVEPLRGLVRHEFVAPEEMFASEIVVAETARSASSATTYNRQVLGKGLGTEGEVRFGGGRVSRLRGWFASGS